MTYLLVRPQWHLVLQFGPILHPFVDPNSCSVNSPFWLISFLFHTISKRLYERGSFYLVLSALLLGRMWCVCIYEVYRVYQVIINYNPRWLGGVSRKLPFVALPTSTKVTWCYAYGKHDTNSTKNMMVTMHEIRYEKGRKRPMPDRWLNLRGKQELMEFVIGHVLVLQVKWKWKWWMWMRLDWGYRNSDNGGGANGGGITVTK